MNLVELQQALKDLVYNNTSGETDPAITFFGDNLGSAIDEFVRSNSIIGLTLKGPYNAYTNTPNLDTPPTISIKKGDAYKVTTAGYFFTQYVALGIMIVAIKDTPLTLNDWVITQDTTSVIIENQGANRLITATSTDNILHAHNALIFDGSELSISANARITGSLYIDRILQRGNSGIDIQGTRFLDNRIVTAIPSLGGAGLNLPHGIAPSSPEDGDIWTTSTGLYIRINGTTSLIGNDWFELVNAGQANEYLRVKKPLGGDYDIWSYASSGQFPSSIWDDMPHASTSVWGAILPDGNSNHFYNGVGDWVTVTSGTTIHSNLTNLAYAVSGHTGFAAENHNLIDTTKHPVTGLNTGDFLRATAGNAYAFGYLAAAAVVDNAIARWDGTGRNNLQTSLAVINDAGDIIADGDIIAYGSGAPAAFTFDAFRTWNLVVTDSGYDWGDYQIVAAGTSDIMDIVAGSGVTITGDSTLKAIRISATGTISNYPPVGVVVSTGSAWDTSVALANFVRTNQANTYGDYAQTFKDNSIKINNPADTFAYIITAGAITTADRILNLPVITGTDTLVTLGLAQTFTGSNTFNVYNTFYSGQRFNNPGNTAYYQLLTSAISANRSITLPLLTANDTLAVLGLAQTFTAAQTFNSSMLKLVSSGGVYTYTFVGGNLAASYNITMPLLTANDILVTENFAQTLTNKTISIQNNTLTGVATQLGANTWADFDQIFKDNRLRIQNPAETFYYTITAAAIGGSYVLNLPLITATDTLMALGTVQTNTAVKSFNTSTLKFMNPAGTYGYTVAGSAIGGNLTVTLPLLSVGDTFAMVGFAQTFTGINTFYSGQRINNPANTYYYTLTSAAIGGNYILNLPTITGTSTLAVLELAQTWTAVQTFRVANAIRSEVASTQDAMVLAGRAGGTNSWAVTLTPTTLSGNRIVTFPDSATYIPIFSQIITFSGPSQARTYTLPDSAQTLAGLAVSAQVFTTTQTFRAATAAARFENASSQDAIAIAGGVSGSSNYAVTILPATLGANVNYTLPASSSFAWISSYHHTITGPAQARTYNFPDSNQTIAGLSVTGQTFTTQQTFSHANGIKVDQIYENTAYGIWMMSDLYIDLGIIKSSVTSSGTATAFKLVTDNNYATTGDKLFALYNLTNELLYVDKDGTLAADGDIIAYASGAPASFTFDAFRTWNIDNNSGHNWIGTVGTQVIASGVSDVIDFVAGTNVTIEFDSSNKGIKISASSGSSYTFQQSIVNNSGTVNLLGDITSPTASQYYGTNASSVRGWHNLPTGGSSQWTTGGSGIYYNAGNVGIGSTGYNLSILQIQAADTNRVIIGNSTNDVNVSSPKLSFWGGGGNAMSTIIGPSIQKVHQTSYGRGDLVFYQHGGADYTSETEALRINYSGQLIATGTSSNGQPANSGTAQPTASLRLGNVVTSRVLDIGQDGSVGSWLQVSLSSDLSTHYPLLLNPRGGHIGFATADIEAWAGGLNVIEMPNTAIFNTTAGLYFTSGGYYDGAWKRKNGTLAPNILEIVGGTLGYRYAAAGTIDSTISYAYAFYIDNSGQACISTTTPNGAGLTIGAGGSLFLHSGVSQVSYLRQSTTDSFYHNGYGNMYLECDGDVNLRTPNSGTYYTRLSIKDDTGKILLGDHTTAAYARVHSISADQVTTPGLGNPAGVGLAISSGANSAYGIAMGTASTGRGWIQVQRFDGTATGYDLILQSVTGNVGISKTPSYKLDVYGSIYADDMIYGFAKFSTYTTDGVFDGNARPSVINTQGSGAQSKMMFGYNDGGSGQYCPSLGFSQTTTNYASTLLIIQSRRAGEGYNKWSVQHCGTIEWGTGSAGMDVNLYRNAANQLKTDDDFIAAGGMYGYGFYTNNRTGLTPLGNGLGQYPTVYGIIASGTSGDCGLMLENTTTTASVYSPYIGFSRQSNNNSYSDIFVSITGQWINQGGDAAWSQGDLVFFTNQSGYNGAEAMRLTYGASLRVIGEVTAYYSDMRLKTGIIPIINAINKVKGLQAFTYIQNDFANSVAGRFDSERHVGLSAQSLQLVLPEAVKLAPFDTDEFGNSKSGQNYLTIQYERITPLLIAAFNEEDEKVEALTRRVIQLEAEVKRLKN